jgi:hypothetical protein
MSVSIEIYRLSELPTDGRVLEKSLASQRIVRKPLHGDKALPRVRQSIDCFYKVVLQIPNRHYAPRSSVCGLYCQFLVVAKYSGPNDIANYILLARRCALRGRKLL